MISDVPLTSTISILRPKREWCEGLPTTTMTHYKKRIRQRRLYGKRKLDDQMPELPAF